ncbi:MAG: DUF721 domain-containing protein [Muribaculaceae bacterium]|nr:DUF721 domain-containing protein [Muribaculaceae bacterium]
MKKSDAMPVGEILDMMIEQAGMSETMDRYKLCYLWAEIVGPSVNRMTFRRYVEGDVLHVYLTSAPLKSELSFLRPKLVERLNEAVGKTVISDIIIH